MLITLYKIGGVHFRLLGTNGFRVKAKKERFITSSSRCRQNLKYENFPSSFVRLRQNIAPKNAPHVQHDYFSSFNQWNHWLEVLSSTLPSSDLKLPNISGGTRALEARAARGACSPRKFWNQEAWKCYFQRSPRAICDLRIYRDLFTSYTVSANQCTFRV